MTDLTNPIFQNVDKARAHLESVRWPDGPYCPHCGEAEAITKLKGKSTRPGVYKCRSCRKPFSVTVGTVFERSKIPLHKWVLATHLLTASKKGMSAHQLHRMLGITYKTAWFMCHRIREAMKDGNGTGPLGGKGKVIEADETYIGQQKDKYTLTDKGWKPIKGMQTKFKIVTLVERGGRARSFKVDRVNAKTVREILVTQADRKSNLMTDEARVYTTVGKEFTRHHTVDHSKYEYARGIASTNTIEGYFSIFKRGMKGVYQHCGEQHLQRYLAEFDFRYSNREALGVEDNERRDEALKGISGKRLTYRRPSDGTNQQAQTNAI
ncbi:MAG: IS1595 family transposase [Rhodospirillaceae bacterium]|nr:IS1595 family transposase [Rhodospirillaceae bacterium]MBT4487364.1 IS1595 family transposase [Rhodospirillaceae bacterium]MBT4687650.1 IS1595 family transposase [Rhodospirillaceae bacterium]MBT5193886.1 IS1595 family transposase [Rhodospirillaceae bacterium]MBT5898995.1 IS1595 family transposase [Rhodospirillaceae bacterium]